MIKRPYEPRLLITNKLFNSLQKCKYSFMILLINITNLLITEKKKLYLPFYVKHKTLVKYFTFVDKP